MKISIVTPVYNGERYLRRTIESVLQQNHPDVEYIVVDGASRDGTMAIVDEYRDRFAAVVSEPDTGMYNAINKGLALSTGEVQAYLNSDDVLVPDALRKVDEAFRDPGIDLCFANCIYIDPEDRELFRYDGVDLSFTNIRRLGRIPFAQQTAFWRRGLLQQVGGFDESYKYVADTRFLLECLRRTDGRKRHIDHYLAKMRLHDDAFSTKAARAMEEEHHRALQESGIRCGLGKWPLEAFVKWKNRANLLRKLL